MPVPTITLRGSALRGTHGPLSTRMFAANLVETVKLGRIRPKSRPQALRLAVYMSTASAPPDTVDYYTKAAASISHMYLNDTYGDCVIAGKYHAEGVWSANEGGTAVTGSDQEVYSAYQTICGPGDNGCVITDVLDYFKNKGLSFNGVTKKIDGYVAIDWTNKLQVQVALYLFGAITIGINLPEAWTSSAIWDVTNTQIVGGHDVTVVGYNSQGVQISSWGRVYTITWPAFTDRRWLEESYAILAPDWYSKANVSPCGVDLSTLQADLAKLGSGTIPPIDPTPVPPVVPPVVPPIVPPVPPTPPTPTGNLVGTASLSGSIPTGIFGHPTQITLTGPVNLSPAPTKFGAMGLNFNFAVVLDVLQLLIAIRQTGNGTLISDVTAIKDAITSGTGIVAAFEKLVSDMTAIGTDPTIVADVERLMADLGITLGS